MIKKPHKIWFFNHGINVGGEWILFLCEALWSYDVYFYCG
jgi:hypothetical protein